MIKNVNYKDYEGTWKICQVFKKGSRKMTKKKSSCIRTKRKIQKKKKAYDLI